METSVFQVLDTRDINIHSICEDATKEELAYVVGEPVKSFGSKLEVHLPKLSGKKWEIPFSEFLCKCKYEKDLKFYFICQ